MIGFCGFKYLTLNLYGLRFSTRVGNPHSLEVRTTVKREDFKKKLLEELAFFIQKP